MRTPFSPLPRHPLSPSVFIQSCLNAMLHRGYRNKWALGPALQEPTAGLGNRLCSIKTKVIGPSASAKGKRDRYYGGSEEGNTASTWGKGGSRWHLSCVLKMDSTLQLDSHIRQAFIGCLLYARCCLAPRMWQWLRHGPSPKKLTILVGEDY